jgi:hypothetical protein
MNQTANRGRCALDQGATRQSTDRFADRFARLDSGRERVRAARSRTGSRFVGGPLIARLVTPFAGGHFDTPNAAVTCFAGPCGAETIWAARHAVTTSLT